MKSTLKNIVRNQSNFYLKLSEEISQVTITQINAFGTNVEMRSIKFYQPKKEEP